MKTYASLEINICSIFKVCFLLILYLQFGIKIKFLTQNKAERQFERVEVYFIKLFHF